MQQTIQDTDNIINIIIGIKLFWCHLWLPPLCSNATLAIHLSITLTLMLLLDMSLLKNFVSTSYKNWVICKFSAVYLKSSNCNGRRKLGRFVSENNSFHPVMLEWFSIQVLVNSEIYRNIVGVCTAMYSYVRLCRVMYGYVGLGRPV